MLWITKYICKTWFNRRNKRIIWIRNRKCSKRNKGASNKWGKRRKIEVGL